MQIGEEKKEGNRSQDLLARLQAVQSPTLRRSKLPSLSPVQNRNTWPFSTPSRSRSGSSASSKKSATTSAIRTSSTATTRAPSHLHTIRNTTPAPNISTSNTTSSGTASKTDQQGWNIVQRRIWLQTG